MHNEHLRLGYLPLALSLTPVMLYTVSAHLCTSWSKTIELINTKRQLLICAHREKSEFIWSASHRGWSHSALWMRTQSSNIGIEMRGNCLQGFCMRVQRGEKKGGVTGKEKRLDGDRQNENELDWADQQGRRFSSRLADVWEEEMGRADFSLPAEGHATC